MRCIVVWSLSIIAVLDARPPVFLVSSWQSALGGKVRQSSHEYFWTPARVRMRDASCSSCSSSSSSMSSSTPTSMQSARRRIGLNTLISGRLSYQLIQSILWSAAAAALFSHHSVHTRLSICCYTVVCRQGNWPSRRSALIIKHGDNAQPATMSTHAYIYRANHRVVLWPDDVTRDGIAGDEPRVAWRVLLDLIYSVLCDKTSSEWAAAVRISPAGRDSSNYWSSWPTFSLGWVKL